MLRGVKLPRPVYAALYRYGLQPGQPGSPISKRLLRRYLPKDAVILEAGAHVGIDTLQFSYLWPRGHIHAFEPIPELRANVWSNVQERGNVTVYSYALGEREDTASMWVSTSGTDGASSLLQPAEALIDTGIGYAAERRTVQVTTIEQWAQHRVDRIDAMWLDMEGFELAALKGAGPVLDTTRAIVLEAGYVERFVGQPLWPEVRAWLTERGFRVAKQVDEGPTFGNVLAVRD